MSVFHSPPPETASERKISPVMITLIIILVILCCCCTVTVVVGVAAGKQIVEKVKELFRNWGWLETVLPIYFSRAFFG